MKSTRFIAALGFVLMAAPAFAQADKVVAKVDGIPITQQEVELATEDLGERLAQLPEDRKRDEVINYLVDLKLGAKAAAEAKVADTPDFAARLAYYREKVLLDQYLTGLGKKAVTEEAAKKLYEDTTKAMAPEEEAHARHILVETEDQAKAVVDRLKKGEDFAKVAADVSKDPGSGKEGGDLGWFTKDRMVPEFAEAAFKLKKGEVSAPVKSQFGWHVIKLEDKRTKPLPDYAAVKPQIEQYLERKAQQDAVLALREKAKVERLDKPAAPAAPATPAPDAAKPAEPKKN
ncbi:MAG: peptidylprolyl isomerase [Bosea sp.]|uniref:peptidylprolyl isomerase n=1 Tax=unclassified Bosea (in: a-proteobacteria) TaxID=2653178 RepID=UPI000963156A|nr:MULTISPECIES: peptidylprolyl isomerase [unclassified Bosea (in: a-proteobacteria)]MBN9455659.1 peptidylprolyl isomerase [Bosea sp. (in: a-proteobacteria)]OJV08052.1 MAG: peptidylprolyl isomerase [Bosea sp. 67-29]